MTLKPCKILWEKLHNLDSQTRFILSIKNIPSESLLTQLTLQRKKGRNDYPVKILWESLLSQLIDKDLPIKVSSYALYRFSSSIALCQEFMNSIVKQQIQNLYKQSSFFGKVLVLKMSKEKLLCLFDGKTGLLLIKEEIEKDPFLSAYSLLEKMEEILPTHLYNERCLVADETYDNEVFISNLWNKYKIKVVAPLNSKKPLSILEDLKELEIQLTSKGELCCKYNQPVVCIGFEKRRNALKFKCLLQQYERNCEKYNECKIKQGFRVSLSKDSRFFTPIFRSTHKWQELYQLYQSPELFYQHFEAEHSRENFPHHKKKRELLFPIRLSIIYAQVLGISSSSRKNNAQF